MLAKNSVGIGLKDWATQPDMKRMRAYCLDWLRAELRKHDYGAAILFDPINIRYATGRLVLRLPPSGPLFAPSREHLRHLQREAVQLFTLFSNRPKLVDRRNRTRSTFAALKTRIASTLSS